jgi:diacylglycerol kinase (ATP)
MVINVDEDKWMKKYVFIVNPIAANGKGSRVWRKVKRELNKKNIAYECHFTSKAKEATTLVKNLVEQKQTNNDIIYLIVIGGDGTIQEAVSGMTTNSPFPLAFIAAGTGNDFVRSIGQQRNPVLALKEILKSNHVQEIDKGFYAEKVTKQEGSFVNALGVGFDAEISKRVNQSKWKKLLNLLRVGSIVYVQALIHVLLSYKTKRVMLTFNGEKHIYNDVWFVAVCNSPFYGGGMKISPYSKMNDGLLNIVIVHQLGKWKLLLLFALVFSGKHIKMKEVDTFTVENMLIESDEAVLFHVDGEPVGHTPVHVNAIHNAIKINK